MYRAVLTMAFIFRSFLNTVKAVARQSSELADIVAADSHSQKHREIKENEFRTTDSRKPLQRMTHAASLSRSCSVNLSRVRLACHSISDSKAESPRWLFAVA